MSPATAEGVDLVTHQHQLSYQLLTCCTQWFKSGSGAGRVLACRATRGGGGALEAVQTEAALLSSKLGRLL
jgi:hypothetical protein